LFELSASRQTTDKTAGNPPAGPTATEAASTTSVERPNDPSSATRLAGRVNCKPRRHAGFAAAHGLAHLIFTQRSVRAILPIKADIPKFDKPVHGTPQTLGDLIVASREEAGLKQKELALATGIPRNGWDAGSVTGLCQAKRI